MARLLDLCESEDENVALKALIAVANRIEGMPKQAVETNLTESDKAYIEHLRHIEDALSDRGS